jgi:hypothetical protein
MTLEQFKKIINLIQEQEEKVSDAYALNVDLIDFSDNYNRVIEILLSCVYNEYAVDTFYWWLFDDCEKTITVDEEDFDVESIEDLYNFFEKFYKDKEDDN